MSDTPRTDAIITGGTIGQIAILEHARQLERELAEARDGALEEAAKVCDSRLGSLGNFNGTPDEIRDREAEEIAREIRALKPSPARGEQINADAAAAKEADR